MSGDHSDNGACWRGGPGGVDNSTEGRAKMDSFTRQLVDQSGLKYNVASLFVFCALLFGIATIVRFLRNATILGMNKSFSSGTKYINGQTLDNIPGSAEEEIYLIKPKPLQETTYGLSGLRRVNLNFT